MQTSSLDRREFLKLASTAAAGAAASRPFTASAATKKLEPLAPGIKISLQISTNATDEDLQFAQQLGIEYVNIPTGGSDATLENFIRLKQRVEAANLKVWNIGNSNVSGQATVRFDGANASNNN